MISVYVKNNTSLSVPWHCKLFQCDRASVTFPLFAQCCDTMLMRENVKASYSYTAAVSVCTAWHEPGPTHLPRPAHHSWRLHLLQFLPPPRRLCFTRHLFVCSSRNLKKMVSGWLFAWVCLSYCLFRHYRWQFKSNLHQTLHTGRYCAY